MAIGTITVNHQAGKAPSTATFADDISFAGDASYPTGGFPGFQASIQNTTGIKEGRTLDAVIDIGGAAGYYPVYDAANDKLLVFVRTTGVETANAVNLAGVTFRVLVISH